jgi:hypothetical protein
VFIPGGLVGEYVTVPYKVQELPDAVLELAERLVYG